VSERAIICDTSALFDYLVESAPDHRAFKTAIESARARFVPGLVLAELDYFLRDARQGMRAFIRDLGRGAFRRRTGEWWLVLRIKS
jgi:predicted nucleic acid-binding protein